MCLLFVIQCLWAPIGNAQQPQSLRRVAFIVTGLSPTGPEAHAFQQALRDLGYKEGVSQA